MREELPRCGYGRSSICAQLQVPAVVEHKIRRPSSPLVALDLAYHALGDAVMRGLAPVGRDGVPKHGRHPQRTGNFEDYRPPAAEGWAKVADRSARDLLQR